VAPLPQRHEPQEPLPRFLVPHAESAGPGLGPNLVEERVHRLRLEQAPLDVEHDIVTVGLVQADHRRAAGAGHGELHLVAVAVHLGRRQDRTQLEGRDGSQPLETVAHLLFLESQLRLVGDVLQPAPATPAEVRAGRRHALRGGRLDRLDDATAVAGPGLRDPHPQAIAGDGAAHEHDVAVHAADALPAEREIVDRQFEEVAAPRFCHVSGHYKGGFGGESICRARLTLATSRDAGV